MKLKENLVRLRKEKGYSQEELAYQLNVSRQSVSKWESGLAIPELERLIEIAEFYSVSLDELILGEKSETSIISDEQLERVLHKTMSYEYKSSLTVFGIPLIHIHFGRKKAIAKGIIAIGNVAIGVFSLGGLSVGLISLGGLALGGLVFGGIAAGLFAIGGVALGIIALGGAAIGIYSCGGYAYGKIFAIGGMAQGQIAIGDIAKGQYVFHYTNSTTSKELIAFLQSVPLSLPSWLIDFFMTFH